MQRRDEFKRFCGSLKISLEDLDYTKEHGFVKGIAIFS